MSLNNLPPDSQRAAPSPEAPLTLNPMLAPQTSLVTTLVATSALGAFRAAPKSGLSPFPPASTTPPQSAANVTKAALTAIDKKPRVIVDTVSAQAPKASERVKALIEQRFMSLPPAAQQPTVPPLTGRALKFLVSPQTPLAQDSARIDNSARSLLPHTPTLLPPSNSNSTTPASSPKNLSVSPQPASNPSSTSLTGSPQNVSGSPLTPPNSHGQHIPLHKVPSHLDILEGVRPVNDLGANTGAATFQMVKGVPFFISGAFALNNDSDAQSRLGDVSSAVSGVFDALEAINTLNEAKKTKSLLFGMDAAALFTSSLSKIALGIMSPILGILSMIPSIDLSTAAEAFTACTSLLFITFAIQSMVSFTSAIRNLNLHAHLTYKTPEQKQAYLESFLPDQKLYLEKLIGETLLKKVEQKSLTAAEFKEIERKVLINGFVNLGSSLIQGSLSILTLTSTVLAPGFADSIVQAFTFAIGGLFALNAAYDIGATLSGAKNEKVPALQNPSHRWKTAAIAATATIVGIVFVVCANLATAGTASIALLVLASILPPLLNLSYRYISHHQHTRMSQIAPAPIDPGIQMVPIQGTQPGSTS